MAYIAPNTDIIILRGCPLDKSYQHTWYFEDADQQYNYFESLKKYVFDAQSYQRYDRGVLRIKTTADNLYDCNYLMFRNTAYGAKWFYAFIDRVEYIANMVTEVYYTLDVMQTWYFDYQLENCFVEREHTSTDMVGENLVPENLDTGDMLVSSMTHFRYPNEADATKPMFSCVFLYVANEKVISGYVDDPTTHAISSITWDTITPDKKGRLVNGVYIGCEWFSIYMYTDDNLGIGTQSEITSDNISKVVQSMQENGATIVRLMQVPAQVVDNWTSTNGGVAKVKSVLQPAGFLPVDHNLQAYEPKNKKLYTYPYMSIFASDNTGNGASFRWEWFTGRTVDGLCYADFGIMGTPIITPEIICYPKNYRGVANDYESGLVMTEFPFPPWSADTFTQWWQQHAPIWQASLISNAISAAAKVVSTAAKAGAAAATGGATAGGTGLATTAQLAMASKAQGAGNAGGYEGSYGAVGGIASLFAQRESMQLAPDQLAGQANASSLRIVQNRVGFTFYSMTCQPDIAESIDNFFTMFGYAVKKVKTPNLFGGGALRPYFNFLQTKACVIHPRAGTGLPAEDENAISQIYDRGITFWNTAATIGDYSLNNAPV